MGLSGLGLMGNMHNRILGSGGWCLQFVFSPLGILDQGCWPNLFGSPSSAAAAVNWKVIPLLHHKLKVVTKERL